MESYEHIPVMAAECAEQLAIKRGGVYVDGTVGGAGHALMILERMYGAGAALIGVDRDLTAVAVSTERLRQRNAELGGLARCEVAHANFTDIDIICERLGVFAADGVLLDLGVSSHQLDESERGFSFQRDAPLDMRMDRSKAGTAADIVNGYSEKQLTDIFTKYGEERWAARISKFITGRRAKQPIRTTRELAGTVLAAIPKGARRDGPHPAQKVFMSLRICVNGELDALAEAIRRAVAILNPGGRLCVLSYHSLEDRIVKNTIRELSQICACPKELPVCVCGRNPPLRPATRKPIVAGEAELARNPRSGSAKLRAAEKLTAAARRTQTLTEPLIKDMD